MRTRLATSVFLAGVLAACGAGGPQSEAADVFVENFGLEGLELDDGCVNDLAAQLTDEDAQSVVDNGLGVGSGVSRDALDLFFQVDSCLDPENYVDYHLDLADGGNVDADCLRAALTGLTVQEVDNTFVDAVLTCSNE